jgi:hypothetical protein
MAKQELWRLAMVGELPPRWALAQIGAPADAAAPASGSLDDKLVEVTEMLGRGYRILQVLQLHTLELGYLFVMEVEPSARPPTARLRASAARKPGQG